jgi:hypothetical protein
MTCASRTTWVRRGRRLLLLAALATGSTPAWAGADVSDDPAGAIPAFDAAAERIDRPGDRDWYAATGAPAGGHATLLVTAQIVATNPTCPEVAPLLMSVHNPEGRWMSTMAIYPGSEADFSIPSFESRYLFEIAAADAGCAGLEYQIGMVGTAPVTAFVGGNQLCRIAKGQRVQAEELVKAVRGQLRRARSPGARRRYQRELARLNRKLSSARGRESKACRERS